MSLGVILKFMVLKVDGSFEVKESDERFLDFCYREISCNCIDRVAVADGLDFWVDDEGMFTQEPNFYATAIAFGLGYGALLYGNVVVSGIDYSSGETLSVTSTWEGTIRTFYNDLEDFDSELD